MIAEWAARWGIPQAAVADLQQRVVGLDGGIPPGPQGDSEAAIQNRCRIAASKAGGRLWRNNVGAGEIDGQFLRWGLCNDSPQMNRVCKSADLIGIKPRIIQPDDVGTLVGQFWSREVKAAGWKYTGTAREVAQKAWADLINGLGGDARFVTHESQV